jgi:CBS domain-containing protein
MLGWARENRIGVVPDSGSVPPLIRRERRRAHDRHQHDKGMTMATQLTTETTPLARLRVIEAMHPGVVTCPLTAPLRLVARTMATHRIHCVVVYESEGGLSGEDILWGVISDLDLVTAASVEDIDRQTAGGIAASPVVMVPPEETLERAVQLMQEYGTAHLIVVDPETVQPVGVLSTLDIARLVAA